MRLNDTLNPLGHGVARSDENIVNTTCSPWLQIFLVSGITQNRSYVGANHKGGRMAHESGEVPDIDFMLDHHGLQAISSKPSPQSIEPLAASKQLILAEFHRGDICHGRKYTDHLGSHTGDLSRF